MAKYEGTAGDDVIDGPSVAGQSDLIDALNGNDRVTLGPDQTFVSGPGDDVVNGIGGSSQYALWFATNVPYVDLQQGYALDGFGGRDQLTGIGVVHMSGLGGTVIGGNANETVFAFGGQKTIDLGNGIDRVIYHQQKSSSYEIIDAGTEFRLRNLLTGAVDTLRAVEYIQFDDQTLDTSYYRAKLKASFQYQAYSFSETGVSPGFTYAGVYYPPSLISWFVQAPFNLDLDADGKLDLVAPMNKGYASGTDTRVPFIALTSASGKLQFDPAINAQMPVTAGARREASIRLHGSDTEAVVTVAHDTGDGRLADLNLLTKGLSGPSLAAVVPKLPGALPGRDYAVNAHSMAVGDINGDGRDDVLIADWNSGGTNRLYALLQQPSGVFEISDQAALNLIINGWPLLNPSAPHQNNLLIDLHLVDVNSDGYDDLIAGWGHGSTHSYVFLNDRGTFSIDNKIALPDSLYGQDNQMHLHTFELDFNSDGALDLAVLWSRYEPYYGGNYIQLLQNDGTGRFSDVTSVRIDKAAQDAFGDRLAWTDHWQVIDVNRDGAIDIVGQRTGASTAPVAYLNDGQGRFTVTEVPADSSIGTVIRWVDVDNDGVLELVGFNSSRNADATRADYQFNVFKLLGEALNVPRQSDTAAPIATKWTPLDNSKAVAQGSHIAISFNELIERGSGAITLKTAAGQVIETFNTSNSVVSGSTLKLNPSADLSIFTKYVVELGAGAVKDLAGNSNAADSRYDFQTATLDGLYHFFVVAFAAAPGATYMSQLAEAVNFGLSLPQIVEIFTTKKQFTDVYPTTMSNRELATVLVNNIVKTSATEAARNQAISDIETVLSPEIGWSRGKMLFTVFGNLASKPLTDPAWGGTAKQFQNQLAVARYFTEEMGVQTETLSTLRGVIGNVTPDTDVSTVDKIVQIIGTIPPGG